MIQFQLLLCIEFHSKQKFFIIFPFEDQKLLTDDAALHASIISSLPNNGSQSFEADDGQHNSTKLNSIVMFSCG